MWVRDSPQTVEESGEIKESDEPQIRESTQLSWKHSHQTELEIVQKNSDFPTYPVPLEKYNPPKIYKGKENQSWFEKQIKVTNWSE